MAQKEQDAGRTSKKTRDAYPLFSRSSELRREVLTVEIITFLCKHRGRWYCDACIRTLTRAEPLPVVKSLPSDYQRAYDTQCSHCGHYRRCTRRRLPPNERWRSSVFQSTND